MDQHTLDPTSREHLAGEREGLTGGTYHRSVTRLAEWSDYLLLDTAHPTTGVVGATGYVHDWTLSKRVVDAVTVPVVLAGG
jgi:phosphoribosylanthranilate isomerase